jgi:hypothetical protein
MGIVLWADGLPQGFVERYDLGRKVHVIARRPQVRFLFRDAERVLPFWRSKEQLVIARWGCRRGESRTLPLTGWTWLRTVKSGCWKQVGAKEVVIPASNCLDSGIWFGVRQGIRGMLVRDDRWRDVVYMVCEPAPNDYALVIKRHWMPVLVDRPAVE